MEQFRCADGRFGLGPVHREGRNNRQSAQSKIGHRTCGGTDVQRIARRNQNDFDAVGLVRGEQNLIVRKRDEESKSLPVGWKKQRSQIPDDKKVKLHGGTIEPLALDRRECTLKLSGELK